MDNACHIRKDGTVFPVSVHYYFPKDDIYHCLSAGEWLVSASDRSDVTGYLCTLVAWYMHYVLNFDPDVEENPVDSLIARLYDLAYPVSEDFLKENKAEITQKFKIISDRLDDYLMPLRKILDNDFLRARYGGLYDTTYGSRDMYFRVSSNKFNWHPIIWDYVHRYKNLIDTVTILRDPASTGSAKYYRGPSGEYHAMSCDQFLTEKGNPVIETKGKLPSVSKFLLDGGNPLDFHLLPMNWLNAEKTYYQLTVLENDDPCFVNTFDAQQFGV